MPKSSCITFLPTQKVAERNNSRGYMNIYSYGLWHVSSYEAATNRKEETKIKNNNIYNIAVEVYRSLPKCLSCYENYKLDIFELKLYLRTRSYAESVVLWLFSFFSVLLVFCQGKIFMFNRKRKAKYISFYRPFRI